jgi:hypothetical protein
MGWSLLSVTLGRWSSLGYFEGIIGGEFSNDLRRRRLELYIADIAER